MKNEAPCVLIPVTESSDIFKNHIVAPLQTAYLYEESKQSFRYKSAVLLRNQALEEKYNAFRTKRRELGYSEEDLKETFGFLLFDDVYEACALGETGVRTGNSTCTTLGDPSKGVYISMYSDCLDLNRWYHGKSGYIAIIKLTKGRVKRVLENYTQNFTPPTVGFDCHVSEEFPSVSAKTSSFLAFERTQYYMYELLHGESTETVQSPSAACPVAIISFSYTDTKGTLGPWKGKLQIGTQFYNVGLRCTARGLITGKLPPVVKVDRAISMLDLRRLLPRAVFETCFFGEGGVLQYQEKKPFNTEKLHYQGIFQHSSYIKFGQLRAAMSSEFLQALPVLSYAEVEVEKTNIDPSEELCDVLVQHMQNYASLINPGLPLSPSREVSIFPDQYDVPDAYKHLYSSPEWTNRAWQSFRSYLSKPNTFQLPISKVSEILAAGQEERREDLDEDVYLCLSSPEETQYNQFSMDPEDQLTTQKYLVNLDNHKKSTEEQVDIASVSQNVVADHLQPENATKDNKKCNPNKKDEMGANNCLSPAKSDDHPAELNVSISSAERTVSDESLSVFSNVFSMKHNDSQLSGFSTAKWQTGMNPLNYDTGHHPEDTYLTSAKWSKLLKEHVSQKRAFEILDLQTVKIPVEDDLAKESPVHSQCNNPLNIDWRKLPRRRRRCGKLSTKNKRMRPAMVGLPSVHRQQSLESHILLGLDVGPLRKVTERWDLKPVVSKCGKILVPYGTLHIADQIKSLEDKLQATKDEQHPEEMLVDASLNFNDNAEQVSSTAPEKAVDEATTVKDRGNHFQKSALSCGQPCLLRQSEDGNSSVSVTSDGTEHSSRNDCTDPPHSEEVKGQHTNSLPPGKSATKGECLLNKLKSVLLRGKRKTDFLLSEGMPTDTVDNTEPYVKKGKCDSDAKTLTSSNTVSNVPDTTVGVTGVSKLLSLDPVFAHALGLTPKDKTKGQDIQLDNSVRKTFKENMNSTCSSADALNLLADLALSASNDQVPPQPDPALERKPETSLRNCDLTKDVTSTDQESVLHALLRLPAAKPLQPLESPSPSHLVEGNELVDLISKEHAYSLPPSSSLLLDLPGTPFQVSPLSGSSQLLQRHQQLYGDGIQSQQPSVCQEVSEHNHKTPEYLKKQMLQRQKFRQTRTFVSKEGSIQVTRQWEEKYDFNLDSRFTSDPKDKTIIRALHGPWDFSVEDTNEEVQLIVHMWIGLFYSRSTARFFHVDSNFIYPCSEESGCSEMSSGMKAPVHSELKANSYAPFSSVTHTSDSNTSISPVLDLRKKDHSFVDHGPVFMKNVRSIHEIEKTFTPLEKPGSVENTDVPSFKNDASFISPHEDLGCLFVGPENVQNASVSGQILHRLNKEKTDLKDAIENSESREMSLVQKHATHSPESVKDKERSNKEDVVHTADQNETKLKHGENLEVKDNPCTEGSIEPSPKVIKSVGNSTDTEIICNGNSLENEEQLSREEPKAAPPGQTDCKVHEGKMFKDEVCFVKEDGPDEKDSCSLSVEDDSDFSDRPLHIMCDSPESVNSECITDFSHQAPSHEQADNKDACHDFQLGKQTANSSALTDELDISEKGPCTPPETDPVYREHASKEISENYIWLGGRTQDQNIALPTSDNSDSLDGSHVDGSCVDGSISQMKDSVKTSSQNIAHSNLSFGGVQEYQETKSVEGEDQDTQKSLHSPQYEVITICEAKKTLTKETDIKMDRANEGLEGGHSVVVIPFIGIDLSGQDNIQPHVSHPQGKVEEHVQDQKGTPFITYPNLPPEVCSTSPISVGTPLDGGETKEPVVLRSESDDRCPTPTIDESPYEYIPCRGHGSAYAVTDSEISKDSTDKCPTRCSTPVQDEKPFVQDVCHESTDNSNSNSHHGLHSDVELRTLRVLQSIDNFLSESRHTEKSSQFGTDMKDSLDQTPFPSSKYIPTCLSPCHTTADFKGKKTSNTKPVVVSASTSQELHKESDDFLISPFKSKLEEVLGVRLYQKKTNLSVPECFIKRTDVSQKIPVKQDDCHSHKSFPSPERLEAVKSNVDQDGHNATAPSHLNPEPCSNSPVMALKPSKSDQSHLDCIPTDGQTENSPKRGQNQTAMTDNTVTSMLLVKEERSWGNFEGIHDDKQESTELSSKNSWLSDVNASKSSSDKTIFTHREYQERDISTTKKMTSSISISPFKSEEGSSQLVHGKQGFFTDSLEKNDQTTKENIKLYREACSDASTSFVDYENNNIIDDSLEPRSSLICTVYNTNPKRCYSFLEQVSQRCLQDDLTQASMDQEHLIFSEQMKQLLKRCKRGRTSQQDAHDKLQFASPMTVRFSSLEEQEDSLDLLDTPLLFSQRIMVDMSDRKETTEKGRTSHSQKLSLGTNNTLEHAGISSVTAECNRCYKATMNDVCSMKWVPSRSNRFRMNIANQRTESINHFDFCDQMKKEMDENFRTNLNSVVKKSCKTKYRFYILVTSDDAFFKETKLEAVGHTAVEPCEFFLGEDSSSLLIIIRNEDIADHICEVPHLLKLKNSPSVQFAGIDEPDDILNLTHQELFIRGGFIMFERATLEPLSLSNMKKISEILQELSKTGKWKWMLHYKDSRRLKETARLSAEAKEKKRFLNWCQDTGIVEVLPYHECDLMSKDQPEYLTCLVRLQVQNISARYPVLLTDSAFGKTGILTMTVNSFLTKSPNEMFNLI
uniref:Transcription activation suppressor family member 2 n=1 Tax=Mastacembelus armatus TaxID=205130 RepID=A0A3Q3NET7_9TELE